MAPITSGISTDSDRRSRCLLLVPRGRDAPADLLDGLRQRRVALSEVSDPPAVMAALARDSFDSVVIVEPPSMPDARALVLALAEYHPQVRLWEYRFEGATRLCSLDPATAAQDVTTEPPPEPEPVVPAAPRSPEPVALGEGAELDGPGVVLTEQELAMLLDETDASA